MVGGLLECSNWKLLADWSTNSVDLHPFIIMNQKRAYAAALNNGANSMNVGEFLKVWRKIEVEGNPVLYVRDSPVEQYQNIKRRMSDHTGYLGEIYMAQILWNLQNQIVPGHFFHRDGHISIPWRFSHIKHRFRLGGGSGMEIDVYATAGSELWIGESKWWKDRKVGLNDVKVLHKKAEQVRYFRGDGLKTLRICFFSYSDFTNEAQEFMQENDTLWSSQKELNDLLNYAGLRRLPEIQEKATGNHR